MLLEILEPPIRGHMTDRCPHKSSGAEVQSEFERFKKHALREAKNTSLKPLMQRHGA